MEAAEKIRTTLESLRSENATREIARAFLDESGKVSLFKDVIPDDGLILVFGTINEKPEKEFKREEISSCGMEKTTTKVFFWGWNST